jgi:hypothetical protein
MKKSTAVSISFLSAIAAGCSAHVHLNATGQCVNDSGAFVDQRACTGTGGYYGGTHYVFTGSGTGPAATSSTVRGVLGSSGEGHAGGSAE